MMVEVIVQGTCVSQVDLGRKLFFLVLSKEEVALLMQCNRTLIIHLNMTKNVVDFINFISSNRELKT